MGKHLQVKVDAPCHEDWDKMTPQNQGRFCGSCQKQVIDFTHMSDAQLAAFFKKTSSGSVCGRFMNDQLERDLSVPKKRLPWVRYFFQFTLPLFLTTMKLNAQAGKTVIMGKLKAPTAYYPKAEQITCKVTQTGLPMVLKGIVTDESDIPVPFASIVLKGTTIGAEANENGEFALEIPSYSGTESLLFSSVGFETKELAVDKDLVDTRALRIRLTMKQEIPVEVVSYATTKGQVVVGLLSTVVIRKEKTESPAVETLSSIVYPNPVLPGTSIHVNCTRMEEGYYSLQLFNMAGQLISTQQVWIDKTTSLLNIPVTSATPGNYVLRLTNKKTGKYFTEKLIVN